MVPEAPLEETGHGLMVGGDGWFVLNMHDLRWWFRGHGFETGISGKADFAQIGIGLTVLRPDEPMSMYHWEADQENFLLLSGEALLIVEGEERPLRQWDFVHCPPLTQHVILGAGEGPCVVLGVGSRERHTYVDEEGRRQGRPGASAYTVEEAAIRHGAGVEKETEDPLEAYAGFPEPQPMPYRDGWLPDY